MQQTPLTKLRNRKEWIRLESREKEEKLHEHISYLKENAGGIALSGITSLIFSGSKNEIQDKKSKSSTKSKDLFSPLSLITSLATGKGIIPIAMDIAQPFLITWGFNSVKKLFKNIFKRKRK